MSSQPPSPGNGEPAGPVREPAAPVAGATVALNAPSGTGRPLIVRRVSLAWRRPDVVALGVLCLVWAGLLGWSQAQARPLAVDLGGDPAHVQAARERIDPNVDPAESLRRLPTIGPVRARAIVEYRQAAQAGGKARPFEFVEDLARVHGIGLITALKTADGLALPGKAAASAPSTRP